MKANGSDTLIKILSLILLPLVAYFAFNSRERLAATGWFPPFAAVDTQNAIVAAIGLWIGLVVTFFLSQWILSRATGAPDVALRWQELVVIAVGSLATCIFAAIQNSSFITSAPVGIVLIPILSLIGVFGLWILAGFQPQHLQKRWMYPTLFVGLVILPYIIAVFFAVLPAARAAATDNHCSGLAVTNTMTTEDPNGGIFVSVSGTTKVSLQAANYGVFAVRSDYLNEGDQIIGAKAFWYRGRLEEDSSSLRWKLASPVYIGARDTIAVVIVAAERDGWYDSFVRVWDNVSVSTGREPGLVLRDFPTTATVCAATTPMDGLLIRRKRATTTPTR